MCNSRKLLNTIQRETLIWQFGELGQDSQIKNSLIQIIACMPMVLRIQIAKLKFRQYQLRANSPNLMLAKVSRYTVCILGTVNGCDYDGKLKYAHCDVCRPCHSIQSIVRPVFC